jgi:hypothetical protein
VQISRTSLEFYEKLSGVGAGILYPFHTLNTKISTAHSVKLQPPRAFLFLLLQFYAYFLLYLNFLRAPSFQFHVIAPGLHEFHSVHALSLHVKRLHLPISFLLYLTCQHSHFFTLLLFISFEKSTMVASFFSLYIERGYIYIYIILLFIYSFKTNS